MSITKDEFNYPKHKHPHGFENKPENPERIWMCDECDRVFSDTEIREDADKGWGHKCKSRNYKVPCRCESHLESYKPDL